MFSQPRQLFQKEMIMDLQQALFFSESQSTINLPVSVINVLQVDDIGQVWFMVSRPKQHLNEFDDLFHARLHFYKKGKDYYLHVNGRASVVHDPEEISHVHGLSSEIREAAMSNMVLIRMNITASYYYPVNKQASRRKPVISKLQFNPSATVKSLQYIVKDIIPVFQSH